MKRVVIESPFNGKDKEEVKLHIEYVRACIFDSLNRGEAPFASHIFFTQPGILNDDNPEDRRKGIEVSLEITRDFDLTAVYCDFGTSSGMRYGIERARKLNRPIEERLLGKNWKEKYDLRIEACSFFQDIF